VSKVSLPFGEYDFVASIGRKCQPAGRLKRAGLRTISGPFDWFASQRLPQVGRIINRGPQEMFLKENLQVNGKFKDCMDVTDTLTGFRTIHDLKIEDCQNGVEAAVAAMMVKITDRYHRFMDAIRNSERVLLIRIGAEEAGVRSLMKVLKKQFPNTQVEVLIIKEEPGLPSMIESWGIPNTYILRADNSPSGEEWLGSDEVWDMALKNVSLRQPDKKTA